VNSRNHPPRCSREGCNRRPAGSQQLRRVLGILFWGPTCKYAAAIKIAGHSSLTARPGGPPSAGLSRRVFVRPVPFPTGLAVCWTKRRITDEIIIDSLQRVRDCGAIAAGVDAHG
jgi:hypothetical protein